MDNAMKARAIIVALRDDDAPRDIAEYDWYDASVGAEVMNLQFTDGGYAPISKTLSQSDGEFHIGWDTGTRRAAYAFVPKSKEDGK